MAAAARPGDRDGGDSDVLGPAARPAAGAATGEPQCSQNWAEPSSTGAPHAGQAVATVVPQPPQKRAPGRTALPQAGHGKVLTRASAPSGATPRLPRARGGG